MQKTSIFDNIEKQNAIEVDKILVSANQDAKRAETSIMENAKFRSIQLVEETKKDCNILIEQKKNEYELTQKQYINKVQRLVIDSLAQESLKKIEGLKDDELCELVTKLISKENVTGSEVIKVSKKDFPLYQKALSSSKKDVSEADILNKKLNNAKYQFKLSNEAISIESGFVLVGADFDLSFEFKSLIEKVMEDTEQEISEILFK